MDKPKEVRGFIILYDKNVARFILPVCLSHYLPGLSPKRQSCNSSIILSFIIVFSKKTYFRFHRVIAICNISLRFLCKFEE